MKNLLIISTAYPRYKGDFYAIFVKELVENLKNINTTVLAPHDPLLKEEISNINVKRFHYFYPLNLQKLAYALLPNLRKNPLLLIELPFFLLSFLFSTIKLVKKNKFDIINSQWLIPSGLIGALCKKLFKIKHVLTTHGSDLETLNKIPFKKQLANFIFSNSDHIFFVSSYSKNLFKNLIKNEYKKELHKKSLILPMGVYTNKLRSKNSVSKIKKLYNIKTDKNIIYIGRIEKRKGLNYLIDAMPVIIKKINAILFILGEGPGKKAFEFKVKKLNLQNNIKFLGHTYGQKKLDLFKLADIFVNPSLAEGVPVAILEALSNGKAIIATNVGGVSDAIKNDYNGLLIKPSSKEEISNAIIKLFNNFKLMKKLSKNALKISKNYDWKIVANEYQLIFNK
ncbi:MAG: glycosyltransferase family 4 protein [Nanoarchaeota archaeon]|mgnify:CR=1 FL=1